MKQRIELLFGQERLDDRNRMWTLSSSLSCSYWCRQVKKVVTVFHLKTSLCIPDTHPLRYEMHSYKMLISLKLTIRILSCEALKLKVHIQSSEALKLKVCTQSSNALKSSKYLCSFILYAVLH